jgi:uncharacterized membrane protein
MLYNQVVTNLVVVDIDEEALVDINDEVLVDIDDEVLVDIDDEVLVDIDDEDKKYSFRHIFHTTHLI